MRVQVSLRLSPEARRGWDRAALRGGVTLTALVEAIGLLMDRGKPATQEDAVELARKIGDLERRNRR